MDKGKASELFAKLTPALGEDEARVICKGKIDKGELDDDMGAAPILGRAELEGLLDLLKGSAPAQLETAAATLRSGKLNKGGTAPAATEDNTDLSAIQDRLDSLEKRIDEQYTQLAKGITALGRGSSSVVTMLAEMDRRNASFAESAADLKKVVEQVSKAAPRSAGGILPHPSEGSRGAASTAASMAGGGDGVDEVKLHAQALVYCQETIAKGATGDRLTELQFAVGELVSGAIPSRVVKTYNLAIPA